MKKNIKIALLVLVLSFLSLGTIKIASAVTQNIQDIFSVVDCGGLNQLCGQDHLKTFTMSASGTASASYEVSSGHCSPLRIYTYVDDILVSTTPDLGYTGDPLSRPLTATFFSNLNLLAGDHTIRLAGEGILGGCNIGALSSWGGKMNIQTDVPATTGHIVVNKVTNPAEDSTIFHFTTTGTGYNLFYLTDLASPNDQTLAPGAYSVSESTVSGWDQTSATCTSTLPETNVNPSSMNLHNGETITCTFTNTKQTGGGDPETGHIVVNKITNPSEDSTMFHFQTGGTGYNAFDLADLTTPNDQTLAVGTYGVTENLLSGWTLSNVSCGSNQGFSINDPGSITLHANEIITCTFTNTKQAEVTTSGGGGGGGGSSGSSRRRGGLVLGASTPPVGEVLGAETSCGIYVDKFLRKDYKNDPNAVKKLQQFLNDNMNAGLVVDGVFGDALEAAVKAFQLAHADTILAPWGIAVPTGIFYITTRAAVNRIMCSTLDLPVPPPATLIPFSQNPEAPRP